jgi:hypothetical protein
LVPNHKSVCPLQEEALAKLAAQKAVLLEKSSEMAKKRKQARNNSKKIQEQSAGATAAYREKIKAKIEAVYKVGLML